MTIRKLIENLRTNYNLDDHIAAQVWSSGDVIENAQENNIKLTKEQADKIIDILHDDIDPEIGINREVVQSHIANFLDNNKLVVVVQAGIVTDVFSPDSNIKVVVVDLDAKSAGSEDFVTEMDWPDIKCDDEKMKDLLSQQINGKELLLKKVI